MDIALLLSIVALIFTILAIPASYHYGRWSEKRSDVKKRDKDQWVSLGRKTSKDPDIFAMIYAIEMRKHTTRLRSAMLVILVNATFLIPVRVFDAQAPSDINTVAIWSHIIMMILGWVWYLKTSLSDTVTHMERGALTTETPDQSEDQPGAAVEEA